MYKPHPVFVQPENDTVKIWRYMDFTKLVALIHSSCLFFSRADRLGDPFEGSYPRLNFQDRLKLPEGVPEESRKRLADLIAKAAPEMTELNQLWPRCTAINCWHMNEHESAAMWKLYLKSNEGVAVQSTYQNLRDSIIDGEHVYLGMVKYINYESDTIPDRMIFAPFMYKRKSFEHEREARALVMKFPSIDSKGQLGPETISHGLNIKVDLAGLIQKIYVAPSAPAWFAHLVEVTLHMYGQCIDVVHSNLDEQPLF